MSPEEKGKLVRIRNEVRGERVVTGGKSVKLVKI